MKILLINHYAGSIYHGMEFRPYYLSKEWVKMGHEVVIVAASFSHLRQKNIEMTAEIKEENIDGIRYIWLKTSTYPLDSYPARWIAQKHGAKFVFELHDLWPMSPQVLGKMSKWHPFIMLMQMAEDYWCKNADVVISLLPDAHKHLVTRRMQMEKYHVVPNGVDVEEWGGNDTAIPQEHTRQIDSLKTEGKFIVGYVGGHGVSNGLDVVISLAEKVRNMKEIHFVMVGKGPEKSRLEKKARELALDNVSFLPPVPKKTIPSLLRGMDVLLCNSPETPLCQYGMSLNKIFDYMMAGKPVLWASNAPNDIVSAAKCGFTVPSDNINLLNDRLKTLFFMNQEELIKMGDSGKNYIFKNYTYRLLATKLIDAIDKP